MPAYDYICHDCQRRVTLRYPSIAAYESATPTCPRCGGTRLDRWIKRVRVLRGDHDRLMSLGEEAAHTDPAAVDPLAMGDLMRRMADATGQDLGGEFDEVVGRLEKGESLDTIAEAMPDVGADDAPPASPPAPEPTPPPPSSAPDDDWR